MNIGATIDAITKGQWEKLCELHQSDPDGLFLVAIKELTNAEMDRTTAEAFMAACASYWRLVIQLAKQTLADSQPYTAQLFHIHLDDVPPEQVEATDEIQRNLEALKCQDPSTTSK